MPKFKVGDKVKIPTTQEHVVPHLRGATGVIREVRPGTGFHGKTLSDSGKLDQWSTPHRYSVDFGSLIGLLDIQQGLLEVV
jgi:hypothetical protein